MSGMATFQAKLIGTCVRASRGLLHAGRQCAVREDVCMFWTQISLFRTSAAHSHSNTEREVQEFNQVNITLPNHVLSCLTSN